MHFSPVIGTNMHALWDRLSDRFMSNVPKLTDGRRRSGRQPGLVLAGGATVGIVVIEYVVALLIDDIPQYPSYWRGFLFLTCSVVKRTVAHTVTTIALLAVLRLRHGISLPRELRDERLAWPDALQAGVVLGCSMACLEFAIQSVACPQALAAWSMPGSIWRHPVSIAHFFAAVLLVAPLFEEIFWRRILYRRLRDFLPAHLAIPLTSVAFALKHTWDPTILGALAFSLAITAVYERTHSLSFCLAAHAATNLTLGVLSLFHNGVWP